MAQQNDATDGLACSNCGIDFGNDYGAAGKICPRCQNGAITWTEGSK